MNFAKFVSRGKIGNAIAATSLIAAACFSLQSVLISLCLHYFLILLLHVECKSCDFNWFGVFLLCRFAFSLMFIVAAVFLEPTPEL